MPEQGPMDGKSYTEQEIADHIASENFSSGAEVLEYLGKYGFSLSGGEGGLAEGPAEEPPVGDSPEEGPGGPSLSIFELRNNAAKNAFGKKGKDEKEEKEEKV